MGDLQVCLSLAGLDWEAIHFVVTLLICIHCCLIRGMASWEEGIPDFAPEFCIMQGEGIVVGLYPLNTKERYYFYGFGVSQVSPAASACEVVAPI